MMVLGRNLKTTGRNISRDFFSFGVYTFNLAEEGNASFFL